ncbi:hypothetical protein DL771_007583 [Monosporascus sp. 5C6A]|nr:hypothetical protein DL771_007583 [Monosporascus sp. 5C6A]
MPPNTQSLAMPSVFNTVVSYGDDVNIRKEERDALKKSPLRAEYINMLQSADADSWPARNSTTKRNIPPPIKDMIDKGQIRSTVEYWRQVISHYPPRDNGNPRDVINWLAKIIPGAQPSETRAYKALRDALRGVHSDGQHKNWSPSPMRLPQPELIEAVRINGDAKSYGSLPDSIVNLLNHTGLTFMAIPADRRIIPQFWEVYFSLYNDTKLEVCPELRFAAKQRRQQASASTRPSASAETPTQTPASTLSLSQSAPGVSPSTELPNPAKRAAPTSHRMTSAPPSAQRQETYVPQMPQSPKMESSTEIVRLSFPDPTPLPAATKARRRTSRVILPPAVPISTPENQQGRTPTPDVTTKTSSPTPFGSQTASTPQTGQRMSTVSLLQSMNTAIQKLDERINDTTKTLQTCISDAAVRRDSVERLTDIVDEQQDQIKRMQGKIDHLKRANILYQSKEYESAHEEEREARGTDEESDVENDVDDADDVRRSEEDDGLPENLLVDDQGNFHPTAGGKGPIPPGGSIVATGGKTTQRAGMESSSERPSKRQKPIEPELGQDKGKEMHPAWDFDFGPSAGAAQNPA